MPKKSKLKTQLEYTIKYFFIYSTILLEKAQDDQFSDEQRQQFGIEGEACFNCGRILKLVNEGKLSEELPPLTKEIVKRIIEEQGDKIPVF